MAVNARQKGCPHELVPYPIVSAPVVIDTVDPHVQHVDAFVQRYTAHDPQSVQHSSAVVADVAVHDDVLTIV